MFRPFFLVWVPPRFRVLRLGYDYILYSGVEEIAYDDLLHILRPEYMYLLSDNVHADLAFFFVSGLTMCFSFQFSVVCTGIIFCFYLFSVFHSRVIGACLFCDHGLHCSDDFM